MKLLTVVLMFSAPAFADYACNWAAMGTDENFKKDAALYEKKPRMEKAGCKGANSAPTCSGFIYCKDTDPKGKLPTEVIPAACKAVKAGGKWVCQDPKNCIEDNDVQMGGIALLPDNTDPAKEIREGGGNAVREGGGQPQ